MESHVLREIQRLEGEVARMSRELADLRKLVNGTSAPRRRTQSFTRPPPALIDPRPVDESGPRSAVSPSSAPESQLGPPPPPPSSVPAPALGRPTQTEGSAPTLHARETGSAPPSMRPPASQPSPSDRQAPASDVVQREGTVTPSRRHAVGLGRYEFVGEGRSGGRRK